VFYVILNGSKHSTFGFARMQLAVLEPFQVYTEHIQMTQLPTSNMELLMICRLIELTDPASPLLDIETGAVIRVVVQEVATARQALHEDLKRRWFIELDPSKVEDLTVAAVMDPRLKNFAFNRLLTCFLKGTLTAAGAIKLARDAYISNYHPEPTPVQAASSVTVTSGATAGLTKAAVVQKRKLARFLVGASSVVDDAEPAVSVNEFDAYMQLPAVPLDMELNILDWWLRHRGLLPTMYKMAIQFLACPASSCGEAHCNVISISLDAYAL